MKRREFSLLTSFALCTLVGYQRFSHKNGYGGLALLGRSAADPEGKAQVQAFEQARAIWVAYGPQYRN